MKPFYHSRASVKRYGGKVEDYQPIHDFIDSSKASLADVRHRAMLHSSWGIFIVEKVFGTTITNSDGRYVCVRDLAEEHVMEDLGTIPTMTDWLKNMKIEPWMFSAQVSKTKTRFIPFTKKVD